MALKEKIILTVQLLFTLCVVSTFPKPGVMLELEDTIHTLREENSYLQERLESLTEALRELHKLLWNHSKDLGELGSDDPHEWDNWTELGRNTDAYWLLEQAFCGTELHSASDCGVRAQGCSPHCAWAACCCAACSDEPLLDPPLSTDTATAKENCSVCSDTRISSEFTGEVLIDYFFCT